MVGPGALPLYPQRSTTGAGTICCFTGSAMRWNSLTFPSMRNGRLGTSGVSTGTGEPWSWIDPFLPFIFTPGMSPDICTSWADSTFAEAKTPAPARTFCKNPRLLFMLFSFQGRMTEFRKVDWLWGTLNADGNAQKHRLRAARTIPLQTPLHP